MRLVQIVPELPPAVGGVGDYAVLLATELHRLGIETIFVVPDRQPQLHAARPSGLPEVSLLVPRASALMQRLDALRPDAVLVHYSGYGYAKRGAPVWLVQGLQRWKAATSDCRLVVMFHELWAFGRPWTSSFWMFPLQRRIAAELLRLVDTFLTNTELHAAELQRLAPDRSPAAALPVVSNLGEPGEPAPLKARAPLAVVFGQPGMRERVYARMEEFLPAMGWSGIEAVLDIGSPLDRRAIARSPLPVTVCGYLAPEAASKAMLGARLGLVDYPLDFAAKSGILAAYAAHGLVPVIRSETSGVHDGLRPGGNILRTADPPSDFGHGAAERMATAARRWYQEHSLARVAACFAEAICSTKHTP